MAYRTTQSSFFFAQDYYCCSLSLGALFSLGAYFKRFFFNLNELFSLSHFCAERKRGTAQSVKFQQIKPSTVQKKVNFF